MVPSGRSSFGKFPRERRLLLGVLAEFISGPSGITQQKWLFDAPALEVKGYVFQQDTFAILKLHGGQQASDQSNWRAQTRRRQWWSPLPRTGVWFTESVFDLASWTHTAPARVAARSCRPVRL